MRGVTGECIAWLVPITSGCTCLTVSSSAATMVMKMEVEVEEDCTSTVTSTPTSMPATGLLKTAELLNTSPAPLPPTRRKPSAKKESEQIKKYLPCEMEKVGGEVGPAGRCYASGAVRSVGGRAVGCWKAAALQLEPRHHPKWWQACGGGAAHSAPMMTHSLSIMVTTILTLSTGESCAQGTTWCGRPRNPQRG